MFTPELPVRRPHQVSDAVAANALKLLEIGQLSRHNAIGMFCAEPPAPPEIQAGQIVAAYFEQEAAKLRRPKEPIPPGSGMS